MAPNKRRVDDLTRLSDLDDQIVLAELKARYEQGIIYTYIGDILLSVNPNQQLPIYGEQIGQHYGELKQQTDFAPHIYAMATKTYQNLIRSRVNQCLLVSGESGAGKTEASKMLVAQVVRISKSSNFSKLHEQIIEVNPLLEAFGNAKTVMNDNSSRFGKLIEIHFDHNGVIIGGERSFHIFYSLFAGLSENERRRFYLGRPEDYRIVGSPFGYGSPVFLNGTDFQIHQDKMIDLKQIMTTLKFSNKDMDLIFALISGILHLCNVEFHNDPETDQVIILNEDEVDYGERVVSIKSVIQANDGRDALAKSIYSKLFGWLIQQINDLLHDPVDRNHRHHHGRSKISILDMAGFENFPVNSLEQLCFKANNYQRPDEFDSKLMMEQLHSTGVLETVKIRKLGYPTRLPFREFIKRYKFIAYPLTAYVDENEKTCYNILCAAGLGDSEIGKTKVFLKFWQSDRLNLILDDNYSDIVTVQRMVRGYLARRRARYLYRVYRKQKDAVFDLGQTVYDRGHKYFHMMISSSDHDRNITNNNYVVSYVNNNRKPVLLLHGFSKYKLQKKRSTRRKKKNNFDKKDLFYQKYKHCFLCLLYDNYINIVALRQTLNKLQNIENDVWCKLIYMEYYKPVAKFYIVEREITVDGHYDEFDGENISLGVYHNPERDGIVEGVRKGIGKGLKIHKDYEGNVVVTRLGKNKIYIKDYKDPANHCFGADVLEQLGELNQNKPVKIFDTEEFKCQIGLEMKSRGHIDKRKLQNMCIMGISFIHDTEDPTLTPCWLMLINLSAIDMLDNPEVKNQIEQKFVELTLKDEEEKESEMMKVEAAERINKAAKENMQPGRKWSKLNQRKGLSSKEEPLRKTRLEIIHRGGSLEDHMSYSWDEQNYELKEEYEYFEQTESVIGGYLGPRPSGRRVGAQSVMSSIPVSGISSSHRRQWAKLEASIREESREEGEAIMKAKLEEFDDD
ncbi:hypothetical protein KUTeg_008409 [Tegillarca granosa]|uniref:Uncharacterized protein n=1 Tax=Tegillarca granosa TaxID=220873 RepID=A0ABQ9F912_TEGGR|nr:hypothetical protein KUTeg_008409 [Tegillarca granosa]